MKKKQEIINKNYLEKIPKRPDKYDYTIGEDGIVTLSIENKGVFNKIAQKLFKKPKTSYVHLDEMGSFIWPVMDGKMDIIEIGKLVEEKFGDAANPLYERLAKYFQILDSYGFVEWVEK
ncbi:MAG: PqqD family protein [Lachnospiraceae bacterium]|nr:PqqD family protein [Lachnospiraceae bacterium]